MSRSSSAASSPALLKLAAEFGRLGALARPQGSALRTRVAGWPAERPSSPAHPPGGGAGAHAKATLGPVDWGVIRTIIRDAVRDSVRDALHEAEVQGRFPVRLASAETPEKKRSAPAALVSAAVAATILGCSERYVRQLLTHRIVTPIYLGRAVRIRRTELDQIVARGVEGRRGEAG